MSPLELLWWLVIGHAVMDFWGQSDALAKMKNRNRDSAAFCPPGQTPQRVWIHAMTAHALMHGGAVAFITGYWWLGLLETAAHFIIDFGKCDNWYGIHADQAMHYACKVVWLLIALSIAP